MTSKKLKELLDTCFTAKRITESMADLPEGMKPRHIHVINAVYELAADGSDVRVSDVSHRLNITMPSVTKLIQELVQKGALCKQSDSDDKRSTLIHLTEKGLDLEEQYVIQYHTAWAERMSEFTEQQVETTISVINALRETMPKGEA